VSLTIPASDCAFTAAGIDTKRVARTSGRIWL
jgi:hypothetical protein